MTLVQLSTTVMMMFEMMMVMLMIKRWTKKMIMLKKVESHLLKSVDVARSVIHRVMCLEENAF